MASSIISFRIDDGLREKVRSWSALEHRTISNFMEALLHRESELRDGDVVTLESLDVKLERLLGGLQAAQTKPVKVKKVAPPPAVDAEQELPDYLDKELWADWVEYRSKSGKPVLPSTIKYSIRKMEKAHANGWDVNELLTEALAKQWQGFVFDKHCNGRAESDTNNGIDEDELKRQAFFDNSYKELAFFDTKGYVTQEVYLHFLEVMKETNQLVDPSIVKDMFIMFKRLDKGKEWNDSILQRAIDTGYILNKSGRFDVLRSEERI